MTFGQRESKIDKALVLHRATHDQYIASHMVT